MRTVLYASELERIPEGRPEPVLWGFYSSIFVTRLGRVGDVPIHEVVVTLHEGKSGALYWAWWDTKYERFEHIYYTRDMVEMCFPYGSKAWEEEGRGRVLPVDVAKVRQVPDDELDENEKEQAS